MELEKCVKVARGRMKADLVLKNTTIINVLNHTYEKGDIAIVGSVIAGIGRYHGEKEIDCSGKCVSPGFIDAHIHIESTMLTPYNLAKIVLLKGTTTIIADPHEIANVCGSAGVKYLLKTSEGLPLSVFLMAPSCVPATSLETSGAVLTADDLVELFAHPRIIGLGEFMNYPGVLAGDKEVMQKLKAFEGKNIDGHAPGLSGKDLCAYIAAGPSTDHECTTLEEAKEKLSRGMHILIREGSTAKNLKDLLPLITPETVDRCSFATDDKHTQDFLEYGHLDHTIRSAISLGLDPFLAYRMANRSVANCFGLHDRGIIAPGKRADLVVLDDVTSVSVHHVLTGGHLIVEDGLMKDFPQKKSNVLPSFRLLEVLSSDFRLSCPKSTKKAHVIGIIPHQIVTNHKIIHVQPHEGAYHQNTEKDILKLAVVERHIGTKNIGIGLVQGFGMKSGALASSVAHDSHNIIVVGVNDIDMAIAVNAIRDMQGGLCVVNNGKRIASLPLPVAGLISDKEADVVCDQVKKLHKAAYLTGCSVDDPFMALSFLALPVIPSLKVTDKGLVDVLKFQIIPVFE